MPPGFDGSPAASYVLTMRKPSLTAFAALIALSAALSAPAWAQITAQTTPRSSPFDSPLDALRPQDVDPEGAPTPDMAPDHAPDADAGDAPDRLAPPGPEAGRSPEAGGRAETGKSANANPASPREREAMLAELYLHLAKAHDAEEAAPISKTIERLWAYTDSATISLLMNRANKAVADERYDLAQQLLDAVVELQPDYAEGWSRRAYVYYLQNDIEHAVGDLRRALALDPNHYKALDGLARILRDGGQKKSALGAYRQLLRINPFMPGAKDAADELTTEVEGRGI